MLKKLNHKTLNTINVMFEYLTMKIFKYSEIDTKKIKPFDNFF